MRGLLNAKYVYEFDKIPLLNLRQTVEELKNIIPEEVYAKINALKDNLFKYVVSTDDEGNETKADIAGEFLPKRNQAYGRRKRPNTV